MPPTVTWGTSPDQAIAVTENVPDAGESATTEPARISIEDALDYMKLPAGKPIKGTKIDVAFIGSCTNGRLSDFREVAKFIKGRKVAAGVKAIAVPGSQIVDVLAKQEGLDKIFSEAGFEWRAAGCSMCLAMNPDKLIGDQLCASPRTATSKAAKAAPPGRTVLMSPIMVAAAALTGSIARRPRVAAHRASTLRRRFRNTVSRPVVAENFAEIFYGNCATLGIPCFDRQPAKTSPEDYGRACEKDPADGDHPGGRRCTGDPLCGADDEVRRFAPRPATRWSTDVGMPIGELLDGLPAMQDGGCRTSRPEGAQRRRP
jgi:hypothetical protein